MIALSFEAPKTVDIIQVGSKNRTRPLKNDWVFKSTRSVLAGPEPPLRMSMRSPLTAAEQPPRPI
jgi:hypothetical protein